MITRLIACGASSGTENQRFHESVAGAVRGITVAVLMTALPRVQSEWPGGLLIWMAGFLPREGSAAVSEKQQRNVAWGWATLAGCIVVIIAAQRTRAATR
ncbi:hypothetical protein [Streptomyces mirabilis]|uniref:hypothetical protein n=1 Tax=Streptomyces mirabilis TaxID=68239 RepID=UPI0037F45F1B